MTTKEYFLSLGYTEEETAYILKKQTIRDVEILKQRIEYYKSTLNLNTEETYKLILKYPSLLNLKPVSTKHKSTTERIEDYAEMLDLPINEALKLVTRCPALLGRITTEIETSAKYRIECYAKLLKTDEKAISKIVKKFPVLLNLDISDKEDCSVALKMKDLQIILQASEDEVIKMVLAYPSILSHTIFSKEEDQDIEESDDKEEKKDTTSLECKIEKYSSLLGLNNNEVIRLIRRCPNMIGFDVTSNAPTSVPSKITDYMTLLNATEEEVANLIKKQPEILTYDTYPEEHNSDNESDNENENNTNTSIKSKIEEYAKLLNTDISNVQKMLKKTPSLLGLDVYSKSKTSIPTKIKSLTSFTSIDNIIENPILLTFPAKRVKIRYLILSTILDKDYVLSDGIGFLIRSEQSLWARYKFLENKQGAKTRIIYANKIFEKMFNVTSQLLLDKYPLTIEDIHEIENKYFEKYGERITLDDSEIEEVLGM